MIPNQRSSRFFKVIGFSFAFIVLAMLINVTAFGAVDSRTAFIDSIREVFGLQSNVAPVFSQNSGGAQSIGLSEPAPAFATVTVALPVLTATPGTISDPITVGDTSGQ